MGSKKRGRKGGSASVASTLGEIGRKVLDAVAFANITTETSAPNTHPQSYRNDSNSAHHSSDDHETTARDDQSYDYPTPVGGHQPVTMDYSQYAGYGYAAPPGYNAQYAQQAQYQPTPAPAIRNPFAPPPPPAATYGAQNTQYDPDEQQLMAQWQSAYAPADQQDRAKKGAKNEHTENANLAPLGKRGGATAAEETKSKDDGKFTVVRKGGGETWEDKSLLDWDPTKFRIMVGNLAGEVTDDSLTKAFAAYGVNKARVIRDKRTTKSKGFGFVEFTDGEQGFKAAREMSGKYIGSHPVTIQRARTNVAPVVKKDNNNKYKGKNNHNKHKDNKQQQKDPLKANTGAGIEKKQPTKPATGLKLLG